MLRRKTSEGRPFPRDFSCFSNFPFVLNPKRRPLRYTVTYTSRARGQGLWVRENREQRSTGEKGEDEIEVGRAEAGETGGNYSMLIFRNRREL